MNELPEHVRGAVAGLDRLDLEIDGLEDRLRGLRAERQRLIDAQVAEVARFKVGHEYENRNGARFRVTKVRGDYVISDLIPEPITWVRYRGVRLFKNGKEGREETLYPPEMNDGHPKSE